MTVKQIMTENPATCRPESPLPEVARMMAECDCGEIPVVEGRQPIGVVTDRDIAVRAVAQGRNPAELTARDVMSSPPLTVRPEENVKTVLRTMQDNQVRRVPVVDDRGVCGIVSQADIARRSPAKHTASVVREVSKPHVK